MKRSVVLGAGGHAKVTVELLREAGFEVVGLVAPEGEGVLGVAIVGDDTALACLHASGVKYAAVGVGAVGPGTIRGELFDRVKAHGFVVPTLVHATAFVSPSAELGEGATVCAGAVIQAAAVVEENVLINSRAVVEHDCHLARDVHVASGAILAGGVRVGQRTLVGAGAVVKQGVRVGSDAVIGLGAVVLEDVPDGSVVVGVPARSKEGA